MPPTLTWSMHTQCAAGPFGPFHFYEELFRCNLDDCISLKSSAELTSSEVASH